MNEAGRKTLTAAKQLSKEDALLEALELCNQLIENQPNSYEGYELRSSIFRRLGDLDKALWDLDHVIELLPTSAAPHFRKGRYLMMLSRCGDAAKEFSEAEALDDGYFGDVIFFYRAEAFLRMGEYDKCLQDCRSMRSDYSEHNFFGHRDRSRIEIERDALARRSCIGA